MTLHTRRMRPQGRVAGSLTPVTLLMALMFSGHAGAEDWFNPQMLGLGTGAQPAGSAAKGPLPSVDDAALARLASGEQLPGTYPVDIYFNDQYQASRDVMMKAGPDGKLTPAMSANDVLAFGVKSSALGGVDLSDPSAEHLDAPEAGILTRIPGSKVRFDFAHHRLNITVPDVYVEHARSGAVPPALWDDGLTAGLLDYKFSATHNQGRGSQAQNDSDSQFLSLNGGVNLGAWRLRNFSTWARNVQATSADARDTQTRRVSQDFNSISTTLSRPIGAVKGLLAMGDTYTPSDVFDSVQFRGVQLASDLEMRADADRDFAPVIRGVATSNARVTVRQNGAVIYETTVAPGPFSLSELNPSSLSGDLYVTVTEADGAQHSFVQGYSAVAVMQREGQLRYAFTGGRLRSAGLNTREPQFLQGTLIYGLPYGLTGYGGLLGSSNYQAGSLGAGTVLGLFGALSADVTVAQATISDATGNGTHGSAGQSWRLRYSKAVPETGTSLSLAAYRYSTAGYYSFSDASALADSRTSVTRFNDDGVTVYRVVRGRARQETQLTLSQQLGDAGSLSVNAGRRTYWDLPNDQDSLSLNWNMNVKGVGLGLGWMLTRWADSQQAADRLVSLTVTVPLQDWLPGTASSHSLWANAGMTRSSAGRDTLSTGLGGTALDDNRLAWNLNQTAIRAGDSGGASSNNGAANVTYSGGRGKVSSGYSYSADQRQINGGLEGGVVATRYGVTLSQSPGETLALVRAPGAAGVRLNGATGANTDWFGYTVATNQQPYRRNQVSLDPLTAGRNVELSDTSTTVIPSRGAVVLADFNTAVGYQVLMTLSRQGKPLPFGTTVSLVRDVTADNRGAKHARGGTGITGDAGQVWMTGMPEEGAVTAVWGEGAAGVCRVHFRLGAEAMAKAKKDGLPVVYRGECGE